MEFTTTKTWVIVKIKEDTIREVVKQPTTWNSLSLKEIETFSKIEK